MAVRNRREITPLQGRRRCLSLLAGLGLAVPPLVRAASPAPLLLVYFDSFAPFSQRQPDGSMSGIFIDIMNELLSKRLGLAVRHEGYPWARAQQMVRNGEADGFVTVPTDERLSYTVASQEWVTQGRFTMFVRRDAVALRERLAKARDVEALRGLTLGSYLGNGWVKSRFAGKDWEVSYASSRSHALRMLAARRFDVLVDSSNATLAALKAAGLEAEIVELAPVLESSETRLMLARSSPHVGKLAQIDATLRRMKADGTLAQLSQLPPEAG
jgi:polar amino acid transport system substrate-binding protein